MERNSRIEAFFVIVIVVFIFVEREVSVGAAIDAEFDRVGWSLCGSLFVRAQRKNGSGANIQRESVQGSCGVDRPPAFDCGSRPKVVPPGFRKI